MRDNLGDEKLHFYFLESFILGRAVWLVDRPAHPFAKARKDGAPQQTGSHSETDCRKFLAAETQPTSYGPNILNCIVYLSSKSVGNTWNAYRDQSQEMAKDFAKACPDVRVTTNLDDADYAVTLNHIEVGLFARDNQIAVTDVFGTILSTQERGSIRSGAKGACSLILSDWANPKDVRERLVRAVNGAFQKERVAGYAELQGDKLIVHSERASAMRFRMVLAGRPMSMLRRAAIATYVYTNDADQRFELDVKSGQVLTTLPQQNN